MGPLEVGMDFLPLPLAIISGTAASPGAKCGAWQIFDSSIFLYHVIESLLLFGLHHTWTKFSLI